MRFISPFAGEWWWGARYSYLIIAANLALWLVFVICSSIFGPSFKTFAWAYLSISPTYTFQKLHLWTLITYAFVHFDLMHVFFNMLIMMFFGPRVERDMVNRRFLIFYFICAIGGALVSILAKTLSNNMEHVTIGASGAVLGVLLAYGVMYPHDRIFIWGIFPIRAWSLVIFVAALQFLMVFQYGMASGTDYWAHIGGLASAYIFIFLQGHPGKPSSRRRMKIANWRGEDSGEERSYYLEK